MAVTKKQIDALTKMQETLENKRKATRDRIWEDVLRLTDPCFQSWDDDKPDEKELRQNGDIYHGAATQASNLMADGLCGYACGSEIDWFALGMEDVSKDSDRDVMSGLQDRERIMLSKFKTSSFYKVIKSAFKMGADIGTAVLLQEWDDETSSISYSLIHPKDAVIMQDRFGEVDTLIYKQWLTRSDMIDAFGKNRVPKEIVDDIEETDLHQIFRYIGKNKRMELDIPGSDEYVSVFWSPDAAQTDPTTLSESRMDKKCFACWRYDTPIDGNVWGCGSPGLTALADNKSLQVFSKMVQIGTVRTAMPSWKKTTGLTINTLPDGVTSLNPGQDYQAVQTAGNFAVAFQEQADTISNIRSAYKVDFFLALMSSQTRQKTATEAEGLQNEQSALLGSELDRMGYELLEPVIEYAYQEYQRHAVFEANPVLDKMGNPHIDFISPLATQQKKYHELVPSERWIGNMLSVAQTKPEILDWVNFAGYAKLSAQIGRVNHQVITDEQTVSDIAKKRAEVQSQQAILQQQNQDQNMRNQTYIASTKAPEEGSPASKTQTTKQRAV